MSKRTTEEMPPPISPCGWLEKHCPDMTCCDVNYKMETYPPYVCNWIKKKWVKISDSMGGMYQKPGTAYKEQYIVNNGEEVVEITKIAR